MLKPKFVLGCDISSETFVFSLLKDTDNIVLGSKEFSNNLSGFESCLKELKVLEIGSKDILVCLEHTGVYSESLSYYFNDQGITVVLESGAKIKKSFKLLTHKTDELDSIAIAEYAFRFYDRLESWEPRVSAAEKVKSLLSSRELFVKQRSALKNALTAYNRKMVQNDILRTEYKKQIAQLWETIKKLEKEMKTIIEENTYWQAKIHTLKTVHGVGNMMAYNIFVLSNAFSKELNHKKLAAYLRICPYQYQSGTSIRKRPKSPKYGPEIMRKLLHLAARTVSINDDDFKTYYLRKKEEGKPGMLVLNNIANKLLKLICAIANSDKPFIPNYRSLNPILLK